LGAIAGFFVLGCLSLWRGSRLLAGLCCLLGLFFAGALDSSVHAPGPPPQIDASGREVVILGGCVVEPPAVSGERERFVLELDRDARAQVTLYTKPGETLPALHYGQNIELDAKMRPPRNFGNPGGLRLPAIPCQAGHLLDRVGGRWHVSNNSIPAMPTRQG
jgi:hypothetical protein